MKRLMFLAIPLLLLSSSAEAKSRHAAGLKWMPGPPGLPAGSTFAVVSGDPTKDGMFTVRVKLPANYAVPPHHHPTDEKVSVKSGGPLSYGMGDKADMSNAGTLNPGYHVVMPASQNHWISNTDPVEIEVTAQGPFAITYADPKDDPRNK
jgi:quercetin dioxygenase-like cupin family protein